LLITQVTSNRITCVLTTFFLKTFNSSYMKIQKLSIALLMVITTCATVQGQTLQPTWWFGVSGAANISSYTGTTQKLNNSLVVPAAFHKGNGVRPFGSVLMEYRPAGAWGAMLNVGYDGRGGSFDHVMAPCNCEATLKTTTSYLTIEPSLRVGLFSNLFIFAGPRVAFNMQKDFAYTQQKQPNTDGDLSDMRKTIISGQAGVGYDILVSSANSLTKMSISPFVSYHPYFGQDPRSIESWSVSTIRAGVALKFGRGKMIVETPVITTPVGDVEFSIVEPKLVSVKRIITETLPLRSSVFFDEGSNVIPSRYVSLANSAAAEFREQQLQPEQLEPLSGRSARQLQVYHNILNILGDRLRANPASNITLTGASNHGAAEGTLLAQNVKTYLVNTFLIDGSRISIEGRNKPLIPSEQPGGKKELALLREGDRRVDITSTSSALLMQVGGEMMKPVQFTNTAQNPKDSDVKFMVKGAEKQLKSWSLDLTDEQGKVQHFGPFTKDQADVNGNSILADRADGNYTVLMTGQSKNGLPITKQGMVHLLRPTEAIQKGLRYSILFDFNRSDAIPTYTKFLTDVVAPLITSGSTVIIHGHTDEIGNETYNQKLSESRAQETQRILEGALARKQTNSVKFQTLGYGESVAEAPFENSLPEERFYNRTVIIDINPVQ
jgi:outer membrane protein OmpA-like peptidoglycan-associated protein